MGIRGSLGVTSCEDQYTDNLIHQLAEQDVSGKITQLSDHLTQMQASQAIRVGAELSKSLAGANASLSQLAVLQSNSSLNSCGNSSSDVGTIICNIINALQPAAASITARFDTSSNSAICPGGIHTTTTTQPLMSSGSDSSSGCGCGSSDTDDTITTQCSCCTTTTKGDVSTTCSCCTTTTCCDCNGNGNNTTTFGCGCGSSDTTTTTKGSNTGGCQPCGICGTISPSNAECCCLDQSTQCQKQELNCGIAFNNNEFRFGDCAVNYITNRNNLTSNGIGSPEDPLQLTNLINIINIRSPSSDSFIETLYVQLPSIIFGDNTSCGVNDATNGFPQKGQFI